MADVFDPNNFDMPLEQFTGTSKLVKKANNVIKRVEALSKRVSGKGGRGGGAGVFFAVAMGGNVVKVRVPGAEVVGS